MVVLEYIHLSGRSPLERWFESLNAQMLGPSGNPNTASFFAILRVLQARVGVKRRVRAASCA